MINTNDTTATLYKQALDHSLNGVLVYQIIRTETGEPADFRYRYANQRVADWLGLSIDELLTCSLGELYPTGNILFDQYVQVMRTGKSRRFAFERQPVQG